MNGIVLNESKIFNELSKRIITRSSNLSDISLQNGKMGAILYLFYTSRIYSYSPYQEKAEELLEECFSLLHKPCKSYYQNLAGLGIGLQFLIRDNYLDFGDDDVFKSIDNILADELNKRLLKKDIGGFYNGSMSLLPYFLERGASGYPIGGIVDSFLQTLIDTSIKTNDEAYLRSNLFNDSRIYLTFPHGVGALVLLLNKIYTMGYSKTLIESVIGRYISFLKNNMHDFEKEGYYFDDIYGKRAFSRLSLIYGDLGPGYAILNAGITFKNEDWYTLGLSILRNSTMRRQEVNTFVNQANISYGAAGLALFYQTVSELTSDPVFLDTAVFWKSRIYSFYDPKDELLGFRSPYNQWLKRTNISLSEGLCGIAMCLLELELSFDTHIKTFTFLK